MGEEGVFTSHAGVFLPSEQLSQCHIGAFLKLMMMIEHIKMMQILYPDI